MTTTAAAKMKKLAEELDFEADLPDYERIKQEEALEQAAQREVARRLEADIAAGLWAMECLERDLRNCPDDDLLFGRTDSQWGGSTE